MTSYFQDGGRHGIAPKKLKLFYIKSDYFSQSVIH